MMKAQTSIFTLFFYIVLFFLLLAGGLGYIITTGSGIAVDNGSLTGLEAFFIGNLVLWIVLAFIVAMLWWAYAR